MLVLYLRKGIKNKKHENHPIFSIIVCIFCLWSKERRYKHNKKRTSKKEKVEIELKDQVPISTDKDMTIEFIEKNGAELNAETGILTWNIKLNSNETKKIRFSFKVKYPKDKQIQKIN